MLFPGCFKYFAYLFFLLFARAFDWYFLWRRSEERDNQVSSSSLKYFWNVEEINFIVSQRMIFYLLIRRRYVDESIASLKLDRSDPEFFDLCFWVATFCANNKIWKNLFDNVSSLNSKYMLTSWGHLLFTSKNPWIIYILNKKKLLLILFKFLQNQTPFQTYIHQNSSFCHKSFSQER